MFEGAPVSPGAEIQTIEEHLQVHINVLPQRCQYFMFFINLYFCVHVYGSYRSCLSSKAGQQLWHHRNRSNSTQQRSQQLHHPTLLQCQWSTRIQWSRVPVGLVISTMAVRQMRKMTNKYNSLCCHWSCFVGNLPPSVLAIKVLKLKCFFFLAVITCVCGCVNGCLWFWRRLLFLGLSGTFGLCCDRC